MTDMDFMKFVDELQGQIDKLKKMIKGAGGGSTVTITPTLESGEKLADYSIDGTAGAIYAPLNVLFSTTERVIGKWIDGSDIYEKTLDLGEDVSVSSWTTVANVSDLNISLLVDAISIQSSSSVSFIEYWADNGTLKAQSLRSSASDLVRYITLRYTKTTTRTTKRKK